MLAQVEAWAADNEAVRPLLPEVRAALRKNERTCAAADKLVAEAAAATAEAAAE